MAYDKKQFLNMLAAGLCSKGRKGKQLPTTYIAASQQKAHEQAETIVGEHFESTIDMTDYPVHLMSSRNTGDKHDLHQFTMVTFPDKWSASLSDLENHLSNNTWFEYNCTVVIVTPYAWKGQKFSRLRVHLPQVSTSASKDNVTLRIGFGTIEDEESGNPFFSLGTYGTKFGEGSVVSADGLELCVENGTVKSDGTVAASREQNCIFASVTISNADRTQMSGTMTLDFTDFFVEFIQ